MLHLKTSLCLLALSGMLATRVFSQESAPPTGGPSPEPPSHPHGAGHHPVFTDAEKQELQAAHDAAFKNDPKLEQIGGFLAEKMHFDHEIEMKPDDKTTQVTQEYEKRLHEAMIKADPKVEPILAKLEAAHPHRPPPDENPAATPAVGPGN